MLPKVYNKLRVAQEYATYAYECTESSGDHLFINNTDTDAQLVISTDIKEKLPAFDTVLAFRGTSSKQDVVTDIDIRRVRCTELFPSVMDEKPPKVHAGFYRQYMSVRPAMYEYLDDHPSTNNILVASHSLGAALGTIATLDLAINRPNINVHNVTFGSPRVGSSKFADMYNRYVDNTIRCVHGYDAVSFVPIPLRFKHVQGKLWLPRVPSKDSSWFYNFKLSSCIKDHNLTKYRQGISMMFV